MRALPSVGVLQVPGNAGNGNTLSVALAVRPAEGTAVAWGGLLPRSEVAPLRSTLQDLALAVAERVAIRGAGGLADAGALKAPPDDEPLDADEGATMAQCFASVTTLLRRAAGRPSAEVDVPSPLVTTARGMRYLLQLLDTEYGMLLTGDEVVCSWLLATVAEAEAVQG